MLSIFFIFSSKHGVQRLRGSTKGALRYTLPRPGTTRHRHRSHTFAPPPAAPRSSTQVDCVPGSQTSFPPASGSHRPNKGSPVVAGRPCRRKVSSTRRPGVIDRPHGQLCRDNRERAPTKAIPREQRGRRRPWLVSRIRKKRRGASGADTRVTQARFRPKRKIAKPCTTHFTRTQPLS